MQTASRFATGSFTGLTMAAEADAECAAPAPWQRSQVMPSWANSGDSYLFSAPAIGARAFQSTPLAAVTIPAGVTSIGAGAFAAYSNTFHAPFTFDDVSSITDNPTILRLWPPGEALSPPRD